MLPMDTILLIDNITPYGISRLKIELFIFSKETSSNSSFLVILYAEGKNICFRKLFFNLNTLIAKKALLLKICLLNVEYTKTIPKLMTDSAQKNSNKLDGTNKPIANNNFTSPPPIKLK